MFGLIIPECAAFQPPAERCGPADLPPVRTPRTRNLAERPRSRYTGSGDDERADPWLTRDIGVELFARADQRAVAGRARAGQWELAAVGDRPGG